jgi:hypothetical protein
VLAFGSLLSPCDNSSFEVLKLAFVYVLILYRQHFEIVEDAAPKSVYGLLVVINSALGYKQRYSILALNSKYTFNSIPMIGALGDVHIHHSSSTMNKRTTANSRI